MKHDNLAKNTVLLFINKFSGALTALLLLPVYTKYFSAQSFGTVDLVVGYIALIAPIISLKLDMGIFKHLIDARGDSQKTKIAINSALKLLCLVMIAAIAISFLLDFFVDVPFYELVVLAVLANVCFSVMSQITRGLGLTKDFVLISIFVTIISFLISIIGIIVLHANVEIILVSLISSQFLGSLLMVLRTKVYEILRPHSSSSIVQRQILKYSAPLILDGASFWIMNTSSRTILAVVLGASANGIYAVASKFSMIIEQIIGVFFQAFIETATLYAKKPNKSALYSDVLNKYLKLLWSGGLLLIALMPFIFPFMVHGAEFSSAFLYVPVMIAAVMVRAVQNFISAVYQANGYTRQIATTTIIGAAINFVSNIVLVFFIGIWAAALSSLVAYLVLSIYRYYDVRKYGVVLQLHKRMIYLFITLLSVVLVFYYLDDLLLHVLNLIFVIIAVLIINRTNVGRAISFLRPKQRL